MVERETNDTQETEAEAGQATEGEGAEDKRDVAGQLERIWQEVKDIAKQLEQETRRGGRIAKLRFDIRGLRREFDELGGQVGALVYEAQLAAGKRPTLSRVDGYDELIKKMAGVRARIADKQEEIAELQRQGENEATVA